MFGTGVLKLTALGAAVTELHPNERREGLAFLRYCASRLPYSKAQLFQDLFVLHRSGEQREGYFVEVGAGDGVRFSNTYLLEKRFGWRGILAEPGLARREPLRRNRSCDLEFGFVWHRSGERVWFEEPDALDLAGRSPHGPDHRVEDLRGTRIYDVETISLHDMLVKHGAPRRIDYLSVDTEGTEWDILGAFDFASFDVRLITVEHNYGADRTRLFSLLSGHGFERVLAPISRFDDWYVRRD